MDNRAAVFIDRDGVINAKMPEGDYVKEWSEFHFLPGVFEALRIFREKKYLTIVVTNQRCIARGIITEAKLREIHKEMCKTLEENGAALDAIYFCPHEYHENCGCRKPEPGMILEAMDDFRKSGVTIETEKSYMIGDSEKDVQAGRTVGLKTIFIGEHCEEADISKRNLLDAAVYVSGKEVGHDN